MPALEDALAEVAAAEGQCRAANVDENDYTVFTLEDLEFEHELLVQSVSKKIGFIEKQVQIPNSGYIIDCPTDFHPNLDRNTKHDKPYASAAGAV